MKNRESSRASALRERCLERKRTLVPRCTMLARARSLERTNGMAWLNLRWGYKVKDVLESLRFMVDDGELLAGHIRPVTHEAWKQEADAAAQLRVNVPGAWGQTGHTAPDYAKLLRVGVAGLRAECAQRAAGLDEADPEQQQKLNFYRSVDLALAGSRR